MTSHLHRQREREPDPSDASPQASSPAPAAPEGGHMDDHLFASASKPAFDPATATAEFPLSGPGAEYTLQSYQQLVASLQTAIEDRVAAEQSWETWAHDEHRQIQQDHQLQTSRLDERREYILQNLREESTRTRQDIRSRLEPEIREAQNMQKSALEDLQHRWDADMAAAQALHDETCWMVQSYFDESSDNSPQSQLQSWETRQETRREEMTMQARELEVCDREAEALLRRRRLWTEIAPDTAEPLPSGEEQAYQKFFASNSLALQSWQNLQKQRLGRLFVGARPLIIWLGLAAPIAAILYLLRYLLGFPGAIPLAHWQWYSVGGGTLLGWCGIWILHSIAAARAEGEYEKVKQSVFDCERSFQVWQKASQADLERQRRDVREWHNALVNKRDAALQKAKGTLLDKQREITQIRDDGLEAVQIEYPEKILQLQQQLQTELEDCEKNYRRQVHQAQVEAQSAKAQVERAHHDRLSAHHQQAQDRWDALSKNWQQAIGEFQGTVEHLHRELSRHDPRTGYPATTENMSIPTAIRVGEYRLDVSQWQGATPKDPRLPSIPTQYILPAALPLLQTSSLLLKYRGQGRRQSLKILQMALYRWLTRFSPGQLRCTIVDPVGLGENFSAFMHLKDYDESLVSGRILTEEQAIDQRLTQISEQIEHILQTYLRNDYATLADYNRAAGEIAEPYHLLVIADFPTNFSEDSARRLLNILRTGPRCGVWTIFSMNADATLPQAFAQASLESLATIWSWKQGEFHPAIAGLDQLSVLADELPADEAMNESLRQFGEQARAAKRVEVSFSRIAPPPERFWTADSTHGIHIPLGRSGPSQWQQLRLGQGTSQHALVAGKTGSGKSTFLHALVTNIALHYAPDQVELYLIDFKKGVEFKTYATHKLPHARVIAIESDREFGVSVLERLDRLLQERGELFREAGVQDLASYRQAHPGVPLPRVLLIVDEFQEFFVEDDRYSQAANLYLDRLVRQGRAFGIHVMLGSQTLGGAYTLARSTLGQMHVRIALQCSEADAHLILSEENTAARWLTRPGEAIYNDANGMVEGNHPFQIAWLAESQREQYLQKLHQLAEERHLVFPPALVFEGHRPADPLLNPTLVAQWQTLNDAKSAVERDADLQAEREPVLWLGEAVSLTSPPSVTLKQQNGCHVLVIGQQASAAAGILAVASVSLISQDPSRSAKISSMATDNTSSSKLPVVSILDGSAPQSPEYGLWRRLSTAMQHKIPSELPVYRPTEAARVLSDFMQELKLRESRSSEVFPARTLIVFDVARFRDLRKSDDDFGFGRSDQEKILTPSQQFTELLKRGPAVGLHLLVWCDTNANVMRWLGMPLLREFEIRILFPMSAADSSQLIDSPEAGRLGVHRALLHRSDLGTLEKFRPYGEPAEDMWRLWEPHVESQTETVAPEIAPIVSSVETPVAELKPIAQPHKEPGNQLEVCEDIDEWPIL
ncbi:MAG: FtsK/SpoIIIE domain-containing protein [Planctomycetaceae bacterium]